MQMKEIHSKKEVSGISRNKKWKKAQKKKRGSDNIQNNENKKGSTQTMHGKERMFCGQTHKPRNVLHMDRNATSAKRGITAQDFV